MSTLNVDKVDPSTGTTLELGTSGDTITIPSGVTIANSGTATGFGAVLTGSTNNQVTTVTAANAISGETNFIYNGTIVGAGADGANADLGVGLHIKTADSGQGSVDTTGDELVLEGSGHSGMSILSGNSNTGAIYFGDDGDKNIGYVAYDHSQNSFKIATNNSENFKIDSSGAVTKPYQPAFLVTSATTQTPVNESYTQVVFGTEIFDQNADFTGNTFTAPVTGRYCLTPNINFNDLKGTSYELELVTSNRGYIHDSSTETNADDYKGAGMCILADMDASDTAVVRVYVNATSVIQGGNNTNFSGWLVA